MRKILLTITVVLLGVTLSYSESCSVSNGTLSYQISGCGEQKRACCSGQWCSRGITTCGSCTATSTSFSSISSSYCGGTATRTVTGTCGSCSYSGWNTSSCKTSCVSAWEVTTNNSISADRYSEATCKSQRESFESFNRRPWYTRRIWFNNI